MLAEAVWDHVAMESEELGFRAGDVVTVIDNQDRDWWWGESAGRAGWFPSLFVRVTLASFFLFFVSIFIFENYCVLH